VGVPAAAPWIAFALGLAVGSFLNVCVHRLPRGGSVVAPPSACPACGRRIAWYDNVPVLSFLLLRGRCRACGAAISWQYPLVELATAALFALLAARAPALGVLLLQGLWVAMLVVAAVVDARHMILPDVITLPGIAVGLAARLAGEQPILDGFIGIAAGGGSLLLVAWVYRRLTGVHGMGGGDVKLMAMVGALVGWQAAFEVIFVAAVAGSLVGLVLMATRGAGRRTAIPFGAFLAGAAVVMVAFDLPWP
jgi:leader peptidase (prepilin peptidase)/N-methyltransferase